jgi:hypothetical protein
MPLKTLTLFYTVFEAQILTENSYVFVFSFMFPLLTAQRWYFDRVRFSVRGREGREEFWRGIKLWSARRSVCRLCIALLCTEL